MTNKEKLDKVLIILKEQGMSPEQIQDFIVNLNNMLSEQMYLRMMQVLTKEDISALDKLPEEQIQTQVTLKFQALTNKNPQEVSDEILSEFLDNFLQEFEKTKLV